jgi:hypothetical protein
MIPCEEKVLSGGLKPALQRLLQLQRLHLDFFSGDTHIEWVLDVDFVWRSLTSLSLRGFTSTDDILEGFVEGKLMSAVQTLTLGDFELRSSSWDIVMRCIRGKCFKAVHLIGYICCDAGGWTDEVLFQEVEDWLIKRDSVGECPLHVDECDI